MKTLAMHHTHELATSTECAATITTIHSIYQHPSNIFWRYIEVSDEELCMLKLKYDVVKDRSSESNHYFVPDYFIR